MENPEKLATLGTQDIRRAKQMFTPLSTIYQLYRDGLTKQKTQHNMCWTPLCANKDIHYKVNNT